MKSKTVLIISHVLPYPVAAGNEIRLKNLIAWLRSQEFRVVLLLNYDHIDDSLMVGLREVVDEVCLRDTNERTWVSLPGVSTICKGLRLLANKASLLMCQSPFLGVRLGSRRAKKKLCPPSLIATADRLCRELSPVAVVAEYIFTAPCLDTLDGSILKIIDTHDMFSRKKEAVMKHEIQELFHCSRQEERDLLLKGDVVVAIQEKEGEMFGVLVPERRVITVGIDFPVCEIPGVENVDDHVVLVVGSDNPINVHGLKAFYIHAWPFVVAACPSAKLKVVGKIANHLQVQDESVEAAGWVADIDVEYCKASVVINPVVAGTGLKVKSVEALCHGKALVATPVAVEGILFKGEAPFAVCDNWAAFSGAIVALLLSKEQRYALAQKARKFAMDEFSCETVYAPLKKILMEGMETGRNCRREET